MIGTDGFAGSFPIDGVPRSVVDYFLEQYKYEIQFPWLPAVTVGQQKSSYLPFEVCVIVPGQVRGRWRTRTGPSEG